jgi:hypothetical protein
VLSSNDGVRKLLEIRRFSERKQKKKKSRNPSVFIDKAVSQIIIAAESAMGEKTSCKKLRADNEVLKALCYQA